MRMEKKNIKRMLALFLVFSVLLMMTAFAAGGWVKTGSGWMYYNEAGVPLVNQMSPDHYYLDSQGMWKQESLSIAGQTVQSPKSFIPVSAFNFADLQGPLSQLNQHVQSVSGGKRVFHLYKDGLTYSSKTTDTAASGSGKTSTDSKSDTADETDSTDSTDSTDKTDSTDDSSRIIDNSAGGPGSTGSSANTKETLLLSLTKDTANNGYRIRISANLGSGTWNAKDIRSCDYAVCLYLCSLISNRPMILMDSIYRSWQGSNEYGLQFGSTIPIADCMVSVDAENGAGIYCISPR